MPYIEIKTNVSITDRSLGELVSLLGTQIELLPGKSEKWLMNCVSGEEKMSFAGDTSPCAIAKVSLFGKADAASYEALTASLCEKLSRALCIPVDRIYVRYEEVSVWGWNGKNF